MASKVEVLFLGDSRGLERTLGRVQRHVRETQSGLQRASQSMQRTGATLTRNVTVPLVTGAALIGTAANKIDQGLATIRRGTGATGDELEELEGSFRTVARQVPNSTDEVAQAIADLNTRTGQTGESLENLARAELDLARIAEEDVNEVVRTTTRLFGDWSVSTEEQADTLDYLWRASQASGIGVSKLSDQVVQVGAHFRQFGFTLEEAIALTAKFEREGVNTEAILGSLRQGLGRLAKEGEEPIEAFARITQAIEDAGSAGEANQIAVEAFGTRAGPDLAAAIQEGRFEIEEFVGQLQSSDETIGKAAEESRTFGENLGILRNRAMLAAEPLGGVLLEAGEDLFPLLESLFSAVATGAEAFDRLPQPVQSTAVGLLAVAAAAGPMLSVTGRLLGAVSSVATKTREWHTGLSLVRGLAGKTTPSLGKLALGVGGVGLAIGAAVAVYSIWKRRQEEARERVEALTEALIADNEAIGENTSRVVANRLAEEGLLEAADRLGISFDLLTDAALGNEDAQAELEQRLATVREEVGSQNVALSENRDELMADVAATHDLEGGLTRLGTEFGKAREEAQKQARANEAAARATERLESEQGDLEGQTRQTTDAIREQAEQARSLASPLFALQRATDDVRQAQDDYNAAVEEFGADSAEARAASGSLARALVSQEDAAAKLREQYDETGEGVEAVIGTFRRMRDTGAITERQFQDIVGQLRETDRTAQEIDGRTVRITATADTSQASRELRELEELARRTGVRIAGVTGRGGVTQGHSGGVIERSGRVGTNPLHTGPIEQSERLIIARVGEELLTEHDPRHRRNAGRERARSAGGRGGGPTIGTVVFQGRPRRSDLSELAWKLKTGR